MQQYLSAELRHIENELAAHTFSSSKSSHITKRFSAAPLATAKMLTILLASIFLATAGHLASAGCPAPVKVDDFAWYEYNGHCYSMVQFIQPWPDAVAYCQNLDSHLVTFSDIAEWDFFNELVERRKTGCGHKQWNGVWVGLSDQEEEGVFKWADGTEGGYIKWDNGSPVAGGSDCAGFNLDTGALNNRPCQRPTKGCFVCEKLAN